jgi:7,8-dihydropterin-6-yl-methyl-4-(beta-D-ribofuranosyl)aminobenzene 5'-phosphate synthase
MMQRVRISILSDNTAGREYGAEHGFSAFIRADKQVLFDTGASDLFIKNASLAAIDVNSADYIALSHGHWDHGNGLAHLSGGKLVCHPGCFVSRYQNRTGAFVGLQLSENQIYKKFEVQVSAEPVWLSEQIVFLGQIPRKTSFEAQKTSFHFENQNPDFVEDDSGLGVLTHNGLVVVSGCAHSGIVNMVNRACEVTGCNKVYAVLGGFHLLDDDERIMQTIDGLKQLNVQKVFPCHCTRLPALSAFFQQFGFSQVITGNKYEF